MSAEKGVEAFKQALEEVSNEPGSTVHYATDGAPAPQIDDQRIGTRAVSLADRDLFIAPSADGKRVDVVERLDMHGSAIDASLTTGFGAHKGPVHRDDDQGGSKE